MCPSVRVSVFKYLRDRSLVFSETLHEVNAPQGYKSDRARFWKKILGGGKWEKIPRFGAFLIWTYLKNGSNDFDAILF